jgi:tryptophan halogenase
VTLVESPAVPAIGVGEGTWPSMRDTLQRIGVSESDFFRECDAAFKQGSRFWLAYRRWATARNDDYYFHPFVLPQGYGDANLAGAWQQRTPAYPSPTWSASSRTCACTGARPSRPPPLNSRRSPTTATTSTPASSASSCASTA